MRKLTVLTISVLLSLNSFSQTSDSCTCIPNIQLRKAARLIETGRRDSMLLRSALNEIAALNRVIVIDSIIIADQAALNTRNDTIIDNKKEQLANADYTSGLGAAANKKQARRRKLGKALSSIGAAGTVLFGILYFTK